jgi:hypothetical protein
VSGTVLAVERRSPSAARATMDWCTAADPAPLQLAERVLNRSGGAIARALQDKRPIVSRSGKDVGAAPSSLGPLAIPWAITLPRDRRKRLPIICPELCPPSPRVPQFSGSSSRLCGATVAGEPHASWRRRAGLGAG